MKNDLKIVFMGTPDFAVASLKALLVNNCNVVAVITTPDKPAGRGQKLQECAVKKFAQENKLKILQPEKLKDADFIAELKSLNADLQIVVAFRMLPEIVWSMPPLGTFNLHASLLPNYRGAAPINRAIMNGEKETGATTFFLQHEIDTGKIIFSEKTPISENETAGELHDKLMLLGADLVVKTVNAIAEKKYSETEQEKLFSESSLLKSAPKIFKEDCKINWNNSLDEIHNLIRGLSPYPAAWTELIQPNKENLFLKIFRSEKEMATHDYKIGTLISNQKNELKVAVKNGFIIIRELQLSGKKRMITSDFLRGFELNPSFYLA
ncbi:MAG TPA: methionyl-tRNA formyltransferase [Bacteroidia bacterium]|nr:methionyl-tRNA formyltransferase [Bacteroidia bacterium]